VTIQFGHNDQKVGDASLMASNLQTMGNQLLDLGAIPVFVTPLSRRSFNSDGTIADTLQSFADAAISTANSLGQHYIDLHGKSITYLEAIGPDAAHRLNKSPDDNTRKSRSIPIAPMFIMLCLYRPECQRWCPLWKVRRLSFTTTNADLASAM
jgi:hypothetical protein